MPRYTVTNFSRGEFASQLYGRVDVPQYNAGAKELTNFIIQRYGGVSFRPGFRFVGFAEDFGTPGILHRYVPFQQSIDQAYVIDLGHTHMRLLAQGGFVTEDDLKVEAVTNGATTNVKMSYHGMGAQDRVYFDGIAGITELNGQTASIISVPDAHHIVVNIDSTNYGIYTGSTGIVRSGAPTPPPAPPPPPPAQPPPPPPPITSTPNPPPVGSTPGTGTYYPRTNPDSEFERIP